MNTTNLTLLLVQSGCFSITLTLALVLLMSRFRLQSVSRSYEAARWLLISAMLLYALHYLLQMIYGFRAQGEDVGTLVNILFYLPITLLMTCATLRIATGQRYQRRFIAIGIASIVVIMVLFIVGLIIYDSLHMPWILRAMEVIYVVMIAFFIFNPESELRRIHRMIENETANDTSDYDQYMRASTLLLYTMGLFGALSIFSTKMVLTVAAFFLLTIIFYVVNFVALGVSIHPLSSIIEESDEANLTEDDSQVLSEADRTISETEAETPATAKAPSLTPEQIQRIESAITAWHAKQGYSTSSITSITLAQRLGIPKRQLTQYLAEKKGSTFRVWLSNLRIEEAKRMLITDHDYSIEAIAEACGFSSRSWMQEKFKASTGMTPAEWRESQQVN